MSLFRASSVGEVPGSGARSQMDSLPARGKLRPRGGVAKKNKLLNSFVCGVTFQHNLSNSSWGYYGPFGGQAYEAGSLREDADVGEDSR